MKRLLLTFVALLLFALQPACLLAAEGLTCWFPPGWKNKTAQAEQITRALGDGSGLEITPRVAASYPEILDAFATEDYNLVYVGSFVQAILAARQMGTPLVQCINGRELYSGILVYPEGGEPEAILREHPEAVAFARGASSGESTAKAATGGRAALAVASHGEACSLVADGKARAAVVKNWWWEDNGARFPGLASYEIPRFSKQGNPDNVLTVSRSVPESLQMKLAQAAIEHMDVFGASKMPLFDTGRTNFSLWLMQQGKIDPKTYQW